MRKTHFSRKNLIFLALTYFYILIVVFCAVCVDANYPIMKKGNPIISLGKSMGFPEIRGSVPSWILFSCLAIYILLFIASIIYEMRLAIYYDEKPTSKKWWGIYGITFLICTVLGFGIGLVAQYPYNLETIKNSFLFVLEALTTGLVIFVAFLSIIGAALILYINFKNIDKPFRFFDNRSDLEKEEDRKNELYEEAKEQGKLSEAFGEENKRPSFVGGGNTGTNQANVPTLSGGENLGLVKESVFPGLTEIDTVNEIGDAINFDDNVPLNELATKFRNYLAKKEELYFDLHTIRCFLAGLATTRLIILEGLSGTGKSSIARYFSDFIGETSFFAPVQTTWRDRTSILGFFNDFSKTYTETEFLKRLYEYSYKERQFNIMVLDEMNISRIEYYFADFLSVLEYPKEEWKLKIMQLPFGFVPPKHLENGILRIPNNTFFIGTANKDDSTYTITDKVYDRAITINFDTLNEKFEVKQQVEDLHLSFDFIDSLFEEAKHTEEFNLNEDDLARFKLLTDFTYEVFDLTFGNRIYNQILAFTPVYVGLGGKKEEALDFMFARKVVSKLEGRYEDYVKKGLENLLSLVKKTYGNSFKDTEHVINKLLKRF